MPIIINDKEVIEKYRENFDNKYLDILFSKYEHYIIKVTFTIYDKYKVRYAYDDILQEVKLEFIRIVRYKFNIESKFTFFTYMYKVLRLASLDFIRNDKYYATSRDNRIKQLKGNYLSFNDINLNFKDSDQSSDDVLDLIVSRSNKYDTLETSSLVENKMLINEIKKSLTDDELKLLIDYFVKEKSQTVIAKELNTNQTTISKTIIKKIEKIEESVYLY